MLTHPQSSYEMRDHSVSDTTADSNKPRMSSRSSTSWQAARSSSRWLTLSEGSGSCSPNSSVSSMWSAQLLTGSLAKGSSLSQTKLSPVRRKKVDLAEPRLPALLHKQAHSLTRTRVAVFTEVKSESKPHIHHHKSFALKGVNRGV